jgi:anti-anti-sigma factor
MSQQADHFIESNIVVSVRGSQIVLQVSGEQDSSNVQTLVAACVSAGATEFCDLVIDLSDVTFMSAATVGAIAQVYDGLRTQSLSVVVESPSPCARRVLELSDMGYVISEPPDPQLLAEHSATSALATWVEVPPLRPSSVENNVPTEPMIGPTLAPTTLTPPIRTSPEALVATTSSVSLPLTRDGT